MDRRIKVLLGFSTAAVLVVVSLPSEGEVDGAQPPAVAAGLLDSDTEEPTRLEPATPAELAAQEARSAVLRWGRDPFAARAGSLEVPTDRTVEPRQAGQAAQPAPLATGAARPFVRLTGISVSGTTRWAIINRELVREGDVLAVGFEVAKIERRSVTLLREDEEFVLNLGDGQ